MSETTEAIARPHPDWRDPESYAYTRNLTRDAWAWEFLRRSPKYRADYDRIAATRRALFPPDGKTPTEEAAQRWGCFPFEDPGRDARQAVVLWQPDLSSFVLPLRAESRRGSNAPPPFEHLRAKASAVVNDNCIQHVLFTQHSQRLQLAVRGGDLFSADELFTDVPSARLEQRLALLRRLNRLAAQGDIGQTRAGDSCQRRLQFVLRALDGADGGASQQEIAEVLFDSRDIKNDWDSPTGALRHQVRRAIYRGTWLRNGGYLRLLR